MHSILPLFLAMVVAVVLLEMWATKLRIAFPILLVVAGLLISFIPGLPKVKVNPDLIFFMVLPPLLFEASWSVSFKEMRKWWRIIGSFAFLVVFFTAFSVAVVTNYAIPGFTIALGFLLGAIVSPPDAVSAGAILKFVKLNRSTKAILEGESLLNDASSLIIFRFALIAIGTGQLIWHEVALTFLWMVLGGAGIGLLLGWIFVKAHKLLPTDAPSDIAFTLVEPYFMYWLAEQMHSSGVLAVVVGGLFMSRRRLLFLNSASRIRGFSVWESFVFILNGLVFLVIGLDLPQIVDGLRSDGFPLNIAIGYGVLVTLVLIAARMISSYAAIAATLIFRRKVLATNRPKGFIWRMPLLLGWTGMRGVVSLAAALAIPVTLHGEPFPHRHLILFVTFVSILLTLVVQGLTLPYFIRSLNKKVGGLFSSSNDEEEREKMKQGLKEHIYQFLKNKYESDKETHTGLEQFVKQWEVRADARNEEWMNEKNKKLFREMLESQRQYLTRLNEDPDISEEIINQQIYQIDLEEERLKTI